MAYPVVWEAELEMIARRLGVAAASPSVLRWRPNRFRYAAALGAAAVLALVMGAGSVGLWYQQDSAKRSQEQKLHRLQLESNISLILNKVTALRERGLSELDDPAKWATTLATAWSPAVFPTSAPNVSAA